MLLTALMSGATVAEFSPQNNTQAYLAYLNGMDVELPGPRTVEEALLYRMCVEGAGGVDITDARHLFYAGARSDVRDELIKSISPKCRNFSYMFYNDESITEFSFPALEIGDDELVDYSYMFYGCMNLKSVDFKNARFWHCSNVANMFNGCRELEEIVGFSSRYYSLSYTFPANTGNTYKMKLKRLVFDTPNCRTGGYSGFSIQNCSFNRAGMVEMFNSLPNNAATSDTYRKINIKGNPCVLDGSLTADDIAIATGKGWVIEK